MRACRNKDIDAYSCDTLALYCCYSAVSCSVQAWAVSAKLGKAKKCRGGGVLGGAQHLRGSAKAYSPDIITPISSLVTSLRVVLKNTRGGARLSQKRQAAAYIASGRARCAISGRRA